MAVQAAPLPPPHHHPFVPFGFPTAESCYGHGGSGGGGGGGDGGSSSSGALLLLESGVGATDDGGGACHEAADFREATRELLSFIDSASSNIKLALDKPGKSKRKVNHRKYLQKQIKRCTGLIGGNGEAATATTTTTTISASPASLAGSVPAAVPSNKQASASTAPSSGATAALSCKPPPAKRESKSLAALFDSCLRSAPFQPSGASTAAVATAASPALNGKDASSAPTVAVACKKVPLRNRNLPRSFFTEPAPNRVPNPAGLEGPIPSVAEELFDLLAAPDYRVLLQESTEPPPPVFPAELPLEPSLYEPLPSLAPLLYAETPLRPLPALYAAVAAAAVSDPTAPFFADCPLPPPPSMPYDYGYNRGAVYPSL